MILHTSNGYSTVSLSVLNGLDVQQEKCRGSVSGQESLSRWLAWFVKVNLAFRGLEIVVMAWRRTRIAKVLIIISRNVPCTGNSSHPGLSRLFIYLATRNSWGLTTRRYVYYIPVVLCCYFLLFSQEFSFSMFRSHDFCVASLIKSISISTCRLAPAMFS